MTKKRTLDLDKVVNKAMEIIQFDGMKSLTLPRLAQALDIRTQSLYNYIANLDELTSLIGAKLIDEMCQKVKDGLVGMSDKRALYKFAILARQYLISKGNLALVFFALHSFPEDSQFGISAHKLVDLLDQVIAASHFDKSAQTALSQTLISSVLGYVFIETSNFYVEETPEEIESNYLQMLKRIIGPIEN